MSGSFVVGYFASEMRLTTRGESMCTISGSIKMNNPKSAGKSYVFELGCDLTVSGGIKQQGSSSVCDILKKGPAKLVVGNDTSLKGAPGAVCVEDGCVQLAANDAFSRTNAITLAGGSIDTGSSTNRLGVLTLAANSSIAVGAGQLTFSDSSSAAWESGATLSITGAAEKLKAGQVRFLSDGGSGLAGAQLNSIRYNGGGVVIDGDGWLRSTSGLMMIVR